MRIQTPRFATIVILLASLLLSPVTLAAQATTNDWSRLTTVPTGTNLSVHLKNGKKVDGKLNVVSESALTLTVKTTSTEVKRDDIRRVYQVNGGSVKKATLIGLGIGAGAGAIAGVAADSSSDGTFETLENATAGAIAVIGAVAGTITGFVVGKTRRKRTLIYEAK